MPDVVSGNVRIRPLEPADWEAVRDIYAEGIATGNATFETEVPDWETWDRTHLERCRFVGESDTGLDGWSALSGVSDRCVYGGVAEVSVYVATESRGRGVGSALLRHLVTASEGAGFWTLQAGLFRENEGSLRLHEREGFRVVGCRERLGKLDGRWRDVLLLERRSERIGVD
jgi:phosphinothricin acetyltransferase